MPRQIAIIPARGSSKRLPRKNILPINGQPMISYPIRAAKESGLFDEIIVSTEDEEIAKIAKSYDVTVSIRPDSLAQDRSTVNQVCDELLSRDEYQDVESFCCIYATAIFLTVEDLVNANKLLTIKPSVDYVMGVSEYNYHPVQAMIEIDGYLTSMWPKYNSMQSQFYPHLVASNGTMYWARKDKFLKDKTFYGERLVSYKLLDSHTVDIDTIDDYEHAKKIAIELL